MIPGFQSRKAKMADELEKEIEMKNLATKI